MLVHQRVFHHVHQFSLSLWQANILGKYAYEIARTGHEMDYLGLQDTPVMVFLGGLAISQWDPLNLSWNRKNETFLNDFQDFKKPSSNQISDQKEPRRIFKNMT